MKVVEEEAETRRGHVGDASGGGGGVLAALCDVWRVGDGSWWRGGRLRCWVFAVFAPSTFASPRVLGAPLLCVYTHAHTHTITSLAVAVYTRRSRLCVLYAVAQVCKRWAYMTVISV